MKIILSWRSIIMLLGLGVIVFGLIRYTEYYESTKVYPLDNKKLTSIINQWRISNNHQSYIRNSDLCILAQKRLSQIQADFSHDGFTEEVKSGKYKYGIFAENLAEQATSEKDTLTLWIKSPSHLKNLKKDFKYSCVVTHDQYAVQEFANF